MPTVDELSCLEFWENQESFVLVNPRSEEAKKVGAIVEAWIEKRDDLIGCVWVATSGSSGRPRFVCLSKAALLKSAEAVNQHLEVRSEDRWLCALPAFHVGGLGIYARAVQANCEVTVFDEDWDPLSFREALEKYKITLTSLVPTQVYDLVSSGYQCPESVRAIVVGGERMNNGLGNKARELGWPVLQSYGLTEAGSQVATQSLGSLQNEYSAEWLGVLAAWQVRTKPGDDRLQIRGEPLARAYLEVSADGQIEYTAVDDAEGWFTTSDRAEVRESGGVLELRVIGRVDDVVKIMGEQVSMARLNRIFQEVIAGREGTNDGYLLALPDERKGHKIVAALVASEGDSNARKSVAAFNELVDPLECIDDARIISEIPRSALGKVKRQDLLDIYETAD